MELILKNKEQHKIADMLWTAQSQDEVNQILRVFGHDARVVYDLMIAATFDDVDNTDMAVSVINQIRSK